MPDIEGVPYEAAGTALDVATAQALAARNREAISAGVAAGAEAKALAQSAVAEVGTIRTAVAQSANSASAAAGSAAQAEQTATDLVPRVEHIETMAGLAPGEVTDAQTANLITQPSTATRDALNAATVQVSTPLVDSRAAEVVPPLVAQAIAADPAPAQAAAAAVTNEIQGRKIIESMVDLGTQSLNTLVAPGQYQQSTAANSTTERGYPVAGQVGTLEVLPLNANVVMQRWVPLHASARALTYQRRVTTAAVGPWEQVGWSADALTTEDLNTVKTAGIYHQATPANATIARNYPTAGMQGVLEVIPLNAASTTVLQRFTLQGNRDTYTRIVATNASAWTRPERAELVNLATSHLNTVTTPGRYFQSSGAQSTETNGYPVARLGVLEVFTVSLSVIQRYTTSEDNPQVYLRRSDGTTWGAWSLVGTSVDTPPADLPASVRPLERWAPRRTQTNLYPCSVGRDGLVYGTTGYAAHTLFRSGDGLATTEAGPDLAGQLAGHRIVWVGQTEAGTTVLATDTTTDSGRILFSPDEWGPSMGFTLKHQGRGFHRLSTPQPVIDTLTDQTVLLAGEYATPQRTEARSLLGSFDGGATWAVLYTSPEGDPASTQNMHCHTATWDSVKQAVWVAFGDGVNARFGYSTDKGGTWTWVTQEAGPFHPGAGATGIQPTVLIAFPDRLVGSPDGGTGIPAGLQEIDRDTGQAVEVLATIEGQYPSNQYGFGPIARDGNRAMVLFPPSTGTSNQVLIFGTGDGGATWHEVWRYGWEDGKWIVRHGLVGPDRNGIMYAPMVAAGTWYVLAAPVPRWVVTDDPTDPLPTSGKTSDRPALATVPVGFQYHDHTLDRLIWAGTTGWTDATGAAV